MIKDKKKYNILVLEDNPGDFFLIKDYLLELIDLPEITLATNFKEGELLLTAKDKSKYDVILLDLTLPDKSGESLLTDIIALSSGTPVIVLTGYTQIEFSIKSLALGVSDYLLKDDINASSLYKSIVYNLERKKTSLALEESEKRYSNLFNYSPQPMWVYDPETYEFTQVNQSAVKHYGYSEDEFLAMKLQDITVEEDIPKVVMLFDKDAPEKEQFINRRFKHCKKNMEVIEVDFYCTQVILNNKVHKSVIAIDVTEKILFENNITRAIIRTQEDERYEIGSELHDNICQILATSQMSLGMLKKSLEPQGLQWFDKCREYISLATDEIRNLSHRLAPAFFDDSTLEDSFNVLLSNFNIGDKYQISLHVGKTIKNESLSLDVQLNLYRILQEQLKNILKYARAKYIKVDVLVHNKHLIMQTTDDGIGFDMQLVKKGIGLANMKRRAELFSGTIDIISSPGNGCEITVKIPLHEMNHVK